MSQLTAHPGRSLFAVLLAICTVASLACEREADTSHVYYVPSSPATVATMIELAEPRPGETLYDLGSGDGRIVIAAVRDYGLRGVGVEIDPEQVKQSAANAAKAGVSGKAKFVVGDMFKTDLRDADIVTLYVGPKLTQQMRPHLLEKMRPGARVVVQGFLLHEWEPDKQVTLASGAPAYLWVVPAKVEGTHTVTLRAKDGAGDPRTVKLALKQTFQKVTGTAAVDGAAPVEIKDGRLRRNELTFTVGGETHTVTIGGKDHTSGPQAK